MRTFALTVAYDGTGWAGFQRQTLHPSIQGTLETALTEVLQHPVQLAAAGRTDAGVHALAQVVSLKTDNPIPLARITGVLNRHLPESIRIRRAVERPADFHARFSATSRRYWYVLQATRGADPIRGRFCWQVPGPLQADRMQEALFPLLGRRDFRAFCHGGIQAAGVTTERTLQRAAIRQWRQCLVIDVQADAFLRQMVRLLVANLLLVGSGERPVTWLAELQQSRDRYLAGKAAPACGLFLMHIGYSRHGKPPVGDGGEFNDEEFSG
ncbi:MAG TPA: tRNA pseudouridine(38-40) synthase TruA [Armatimonadota bacterium]|jgi:tRNA pseudouridine38-40 synthase